MEKLWRGELPTIGRRKLLAVLVDAWRKCVCVCVWGGLWWVVVYGISAQGVGRGVAEERVGGGDGGVREFRECQLRAERGCGGASRWALCVDNTV